MRLANEDLAKLTQLYLWNDQRRIKLVTQNFHEETDQQDIEIPEEELVDYIGITYNK